jgi:hypothetical protein
VEAKNKVDFIKIYGKDGVHRTDSQSCQITALVIGSVATFGFCSAWLLRLVTPTLFRTYLILSILRVS